MSNSVLIIKAKLGQSEAEQKISIKIINGIIMVQTGNNLKVSKAFCLFFFFDHYLISVDRLCNIFHEENSWSGRL